MFWRGQPDPDVIFGAEDLYLIPFSLLWGGFANVWELAVTSGGFTFGTIWGAPFVAVGLYLIAGRFVYQRANRKRTRCCTTDRRIVVARKAGRDLRSVPLAQPSRVTRRRDGRHATLHWEVPGGPPVRRGPVGTTGHGSGLRATDSGWPVGSQGAQGTVGCFDITGGGHRPPGHRQRRHVARHPAGARRTAGRGETGSVKDVAIRDDTIRLGQLLKLADLVGDGSEARQAIAAGDVTVNGEVEHRRGRQLVRGDVVSLGGASARVA